MEISLSKIHPSIGLKPYTEMMFYRLGFSVRESRGHPIRIVLSPVDLWPLVVLIELPFEIHPLCARVNANTEIVVCVHVAWHYVPLERGDGRTF